MYPLILFVHKTKSLFVGEKHDILPLSLDGKGITSAAVEGALPPGGEVVEGVGEAGGLNVLGGEVKDGYLLSGVAVEGVLALAGDEDTVVSIASHVAPHAHVFDK